MGYNWKHRLYQGGGKVSNTFNDLIPKIVSIRTSSDMILSHTGLNTPVKQIKILPYANPPELNAFLSTLKPKEKTVIQVWNDIKQVIFKNWMPDKIHVIGSSSGYDSRLIAKAIKELYQKYGKDWLGETYFIECGGEGIGFKAIMKQLGWTNYVIWEPDYTFEYFMDQHKKFNGLCAFPVNQWYDYYMKQFNEEDIQYISGYGGNVADCMNDDSDYMKPIKQRLGLHSRLKHYFRTQYYYQITAFKTPKYSLHPFWSWDYIQSTSGFKHNQRRTAEYLSRIFVKECASIPRMDIRRDVKRLEHRTVKPEVLKKLHEWYQETSYGKLRPTIPKAAIEYSYWWLNVCIASFLKDHHEK
jgi:hypothetical protein